MLYYAALRFVVSSAMLRTMCYAMLHCALLCDGAKLDVIGGCNSAVLCCAMLCYAKLTYALLCYAMLT
jgi:hypothetical protein